MRTDAETGNRVEPGRRGTTGKSAVKKRLKWIAIAVVGLLIVVVGSAYGYIRYLNGRLHHTQVTADKAGRPPAADKDAQGRSPLNVLLIGNDSRVGEGRRYGAEGHEGLADVAILLHLSADRTNATLVNVPRDTMVDIPRCEIGSGKDKKVTEARFGMFNDSFRDIGAPCTVATVDRMLQVRIDHYIEVDFKGVRDLTEAVGGVPICLDAPIHDPVLRNGGGGTGLDLPAGPNNLSGNDALQFLRARHAFGDGSDLARIEAQKIFLMSLARELKNNAKLSNVEGMFKIANSAVGALTVDNDLAGVDKLIDLAEEIKKVPEKRMAFTTLPTEQYRPAPDQVQPRRPAADDLWAAIRADRPITEQDPKAASPLPVATTPPPPPQTLAPVDAAKITVTVDTGTAQRRITPVVQALKKQGYKAVPGSTLPDGREHANSRITYPEDRRDQAKAVAVALGLPETALEVARAGDTTIKLLIGADLPESNAEADPDTDDAAPKSTATTAPSTPEPPKAADLGLETADNTKCASPRKS
jgi:LCP family protein required for cell wall assembly